MKNETPNTEAQKTKAPTNHWGTGLDPQTGQEESRSGKGTPQRDIRPGAHPEADGEQNAVGGKSNAS